VTLMRFAWSRDVVEDYLVQDLLAHNRPSPSADSLALPGLHTGSLCGTHQLCCVLKELGYSYRFVYGGFATGRPALRSSPLRERRRRAALFSGREWGGSGAVYPAWPRWRWMS